MISYNIFFPTKNLRDIYMQRISNIFQNMNLKNKDDSSNEYTNIIKYKHSHKTIPGYWVSIKLYHDSLAKSICESMDKIIPRFWNEENLFFPKEILPLGQMKDLWVQKYNFVQDPFNKDAWKLFYRETKKHWDAGSVNVNM